jgi:hypothetical protein
MRVPPGSQLVFNQIMTSGGVSGPGPSLTSDPKFNDWLGRPNELRLFVVVDRISVDNKSGTIDIKVQDTGDEELAWATGVDAGSPLFAGPGTQIFTVADTWQARGGRPSLGYRRLSVAYDVDDPTVVTARVRIWAAGRNGYRRFSRLMMDERVDGTVPLYAAHEACAWLAGTDDIAWGVITDDITGSLVTLTVLLEDGPNGKAWEQIPVGPYNLPNPNPIIVSGMPGLETGICLSGFARFGIKLGGTTPGARVRLWVTGRDARAG